MNSPAPVNHRVQVAGAVTIIFGILTAMLPAAWMVILLVIHDTQETPPTAEWSLMLLVGMVFVLLGWGILRHIRLCAATAGLLAAGALAVQLAAAITRTGSVSVFFLVLSLLVVTANWFAWRQINVPAREQPVQLLNEEA